MTFLIAWTGGYEPPSFFASKDKDEALDKFGDWSRALEPDGGESVHALLLHDDCRIDVLEVYTGEEDID